MGGSNVIYSAERAANYGAGMRLPALQAAQGGLGGGGRARGGEPPPPRLYGSITLERSPFHGGW